MKPKNANTVDPRRLQSLFIPVDDFVKLDIPPRTWLVEGVIPHPSLGMIYAYRGVGKTLVTMELALRLSYGQPWLGYDVPAKRTGLYIDGEMPRADMIQRLKRQCFPDVPPNRLNLLSAESLALDHCNLNFALETDRQAFNQAVALWERDNCVAMDFIILDNWTSLIRGIDENDNSEMDAIKAWLILLRHAGISVILVHHAGKSGGQRGGSAREDVLDYSFRLRRTETMDESNVLLEWDKMRGGMDGERSFPVDITTTEESVKLTRAEAWKKKKVADTRIYDYLKATGPASFETLMEALAVSRATLFRCLKVEIETNRIRKLENGTYEID